MTEHDQEAEDLAASVRHSMTQRGRAARNWQRQAEHHEATIQALRKELEGLRAVNSELRAAADRLERQLAEAHQGMEEEHAAG